MPKRKELSTTIVVRHKRYTYLTHTTSKREINRIKKLNPNTSFVVRKRTAKLPSGRKATAYHLYVRRRKHKRRHK